MIGPNRMNEPTQMIDPPPVIHKTCLPTYLIHLFEYISKWIN